MLPRGSREFCMIYHVLPGLGLYYAYPAQHITTAGYGPDDIDGDVSPTCDNAALHYIVLHTSLLLSGSETNCVQPGHP